MTTEEVMYNLIQSGDLNSRLVAEDLAIENNCGLPISIIEQLDMALVSRANTGEYEYICERLIYRDSILKIRMAMTGDYDHFREVRKEG